MLKTGFFCVFGGSESVLRIVLTICFALYGRFLTLSQGEKRWFQTTLKLEGSKTTCFSIYGHPSRPVMVLEGFQWFQSGFRVVLERSETVWFQMGFRVV